MVCPCRKVEVVHVHDIGSIHCSMAYDSNDAMGGGGDGGPMKGASQGVGDSVSLQSGPLPINFAVL